MNNKRKLLWFAIFIGIVIILLAYCLVHSFNNTTITLSLQSGGTSIPCHFQIGQTRDKIVDIFENASINYTHVQDSFIVKVDWGQYLFFFHGEKLIRIEAENAIDGIGVILPKDYHD